MGSMSRKLLSASMAVVMVAPMAQSISLAEEKNSSEDYLMNDEIKKMKEENKKIDVEDVLADIGQPNHEKFEEYDLGNWSSDILTLESEFFTSPTDTKNSFLSPFAYGVITKDVFESMKTNFNSNLINDNNIEKVIRTNTFGSYSAFESGLEDLKINTNVTGKILIDTKNQDKGVSINKDKVLKNSINIGVNISPLIAYSDFYNKGKENYKYKDKDNSYPSDIENILNDPNPDHDYTPQDFSYNTVDTYVINGEIILNLFLPKGVDYSDITTKSDNEYKNISINGFLGKILYIKSVSNKGGKLTIKLGINPENTKLSPFTDFNNTSKDIMTVSKENFYNSREELIGNRIEKDKKEDYNNVDFYDLSVTIKNIKFNNISLKDKYQSLSTVSGYLLYSGKVKDKNEYSNTAIDTFAANNGDKGPITKEFNFKSNKVTFKIENKEKDSKEKYKDLKDVLVATGLNIKDNVDNTQTMPENPKRSGYEFKGWSTKPDGSGEKFTDLSTVNDDITVYPVWEKIKNDRKKSSGTKTYTNKDTDTNKQETSKEPDRLSGNNRVSTAIEVSRKMYSHANAVIIANKDKFSDVLTAVPFASQIKAPILFTDSDKLPEETKAEIQRLNPSIVYINGGKKSVSEAIEKDLKNEARNVYRFNGKDRYDTAKLIGDEVRERGSKNIVEIASGELFPDALSISSLAVKENAPILLSTKNDLTEKTKEALSSWKINKVTIAGQTNTLSKKIEDNVRYGFNEKNVFAGTKNTLRLGGVDRYETSAIIAKYALPDSTLGVYASGELFADSLIAGPYAAINNAPVLLLQRSNIPKSIEKHTVESKIEKATVIGGTRTVSENVYNILMNILKAKQK